MFGNFWPFSSWFSQETPERKTISVPKPLVLESDEELELAHRFLNSIILLIDENDFMYLEQGKTVLVKGKVVPMELLLFIPSNQWSSIGNAIENLSVIAELDANPKEFRLLASGFCENQIIKDKENNMIIKTPAQRNGFMKKEGNEYSIAVSLPSGTGRISCRKFSIEIAYSRKWKGLASVFSPVVSFMMLMKGFPETVTDWFRKYWLTSWNIAAAFSSGELLVDIPGKLNICYCKEIGLDFGKLLQEEFKVGNQESVERLVDFPFFVLFMVVFCDHQMLCPLPDHLKERFRDLMAICLEQNPRICKLSKETLTQYANYLHTLTFDIQQEHSFKMVKLLRETFTSQFSLLLTWYWFLEEVERNELLLLAGEFFNLFGV